MTDFQKTLDEYTSLVDNALTDYLPDEDCPQKNVVKAMAYSLLDGGKRVRAVLALAFYKLACPDGDVKKALPFAAAIEMVHAYSLIHDDLPCMDNSDMRRGKPSCHAAFGEDIALLAGDALLTLAFERCTGAEAVSAFGAEKSLICANMLSGASGWAGMVGGQVIDLESGGKNIGPEPLREMDEKKTGALIAASAMIGCILGGAGENTAALAREFALKLGLAFQIVDDILDKTGDEILLGKPVGGDESNGKSTYTGCYGLEGAKALAGRLSAEAKDALNASGLDASFLCALTDMLLERKY